MKYFKVVNTGLGAVCPNPQRLVFLTILAIFSNLAISSKLASPSVIFVKISSILLVPILQGAHLPQDSF